MVEAVARAAQVPAAAVRRAAMLAGDLGPVARAALAEGDVARSTRSPSSSYAGPADARRLGGGRRREALARSATRRSNTSSTAPASRSTRRATTSACTRGRCSDVTAAVPEIVDGRTRAAARDAILDGEAIALAPDGTPHPFQIDDAAVRPQARCRAAAQTSCRSRRSSSTASTSTARPLIDEPLARRIARPARDRRRPLSCRASCRPTADAGARLLRATRWRAATKA